MVTEASEMGLAVLARLMWLVLVPALGGEMCTFPRTCGQPASLLRDPPASIFPGVDYLYAW